MFDAAARTAIARTARDLGVEPAALLAVAEVESAGRAHARVNGRDEPLIRFEGHYMHRLTRGTKRSRAVREGLASPRAGGVRNPRSQSARWKLLERARAIDREAADQSVSWGLGQVMGANWRALGYGSVGELVAEARSGAGGQVAVMARFIRANGLAGALRRRDWRAFARAYNGPAYARNAYDARMARAYARWARVDDRALNARAIDPAPIDAPTADATGARASPRSHPRSRPPSRPHPQPRSTSAPASPPPLLRRGARGEAVASLQRALGVAADGAFGPVTEATLRRFQRRHALAPDGVAGPRTWAALERTAQRARMRAAFARALLGPWRALGRLARRLVRRLARRIVRRLVTGGSRTAC